VTVEAMGRRLGKAGVRGKTSDSLASVSI
jgi:hypothetical protein